MGFYPDQGDSEELPLLAVELERVTALQQQRDEEEHQEV